MYFRRQFIKIDIDILLKKIKRATRPKENDLIITELEK